MAAINASHHRQNGRVATNLSGCMRLLGGMQAIIKAKVDSLSRALKLF